MNRRDMVLVAVLAVLAPVGAWSASTPKEQDGKGAPLGGAGLLESNAAAKTLKVLAAARGLRIGANYDYALRSAAHDRAFEREYNVMVIGTFFGDGSYKSRSETDFSEMDTKVDWGLARNMELHGHTLVWFADEELPDWVKRTPKADVEAIMNEHIDSVMGRHAGKIRLWDVVNEAVEDDGTLRQGHTWAKAMGNDYIRKAFVRAHAADPAAILRYNDYGMDNSKEKFKGVKALLLSLKDQGAPVHALGWQLHVKPGSCDPATLLARMNEIADLGFDNYITELDVELPEDPSEADYEGQKQAFKAIVKMFLAARRRKTIVVWGLRDGSPYWLTDNHPLLFDKNLRKKPAYFGVQEALLEP